MEETHTIPKDTFVYWFHKNLIYCEDTHSFTHRLFDRIKNNMYELKEGVLHLHKMDKKDAQNMAWDIMKEMIEEWKKRGDKNESGRTTTNTKQTTT